MIFDIKFPVLLFRETCDFCKSMYYKDLGVFGGIGYAKNGIKVMKIWETCGNDLATLYNLMSYNPQSFQM